MAIIESDFSDDSADEDVPPGWIERGDIRLNPDPWATVSTGSEILVYFEVYGIALAGDAHSTGSYRVEATLTRGKGKPVVATSSVTQVGSTNDPRLLALDVQSQKAGTYTLTITVEDLASGETASANRQILIQRGDD